MPRSLSDTWKQSSCVKYAVMLVVGYHGLLYPFVLYSNFWAVIILIAVFLYHAPDWGGLAITTLVCLVGVGDMLVAIVRALLQLAR